MLIASYTKQRLFKTEDVPFLTKYVSFCGRGFCPGEILSREILSGGFCPRGLCPEAGYTATGIELPPCGLIQYFSLFIVVY